MCVNKYGLLKFFLRYESTKIQNSILFFSFQMSDETLDNVDKAHSLLHTVFDLHKCLYIIIYSYYDQR